MNSEEGRIWASILTGTVVTLVFNGFFKNQWMQSCIRDLTPFGCDPRTLLAVWVSAVIFGVIVGVGVFFSITPE